MSFLLFPSDLFGIVPVAELTIVGQNEAAADAVNGGIVDCSAPDEAGTFAAERRGLVVLANSGPREQLVIGGDGFVKKLR